MTANALKYVGGVIAGLLILGLGFGTFDPLMALASLAGFIWGSRYSPELYLAVAAVIVVGTTGSRFLVGAGLATVAMFFARVCLIASETLEGFAIHSPE